MYCFKNKINSMILLIALLMVFQACKKDDETITPTVPIEHQRGEIASVSVLDAYTIADIQQILSNGGAIIPFQMEYEVDAYAVRYYSVNKEGEVILVSGGLYLPKTTSALPMISMQHGTETKRDRVASVSPTNSVEATIGLLSASMGYATIIPDYPGFGASSCMHPYLHAAANVPCVIDLIQAGKEICNEKDVALTGELFLTGYSEGGYVSLLTQKKIEESYQGQLSITAVAPLSGPYDLSGMFEMIFGGGSYSNPAYIAYFLTAYNDIYQWDCLNTFFKSPYASMMPDLFNGSKSWGQIVNQLPSELNDLMHDDFTGNYFNFKTSMLMDAISENTMLNWKPEAPVHFFHGDCDDIVDCMNAHNALDAFLLNGATDVQLTLIPGGNHESTGPLAIEGALGWFNTFQEDK